MRGVLLVAIVLGLLLPVPARAHDAGSTLITVVPGQERVGLIAQIPLSRIDFAYGTKLDRDPQQSVPANRTWLTTLVRDRVAVIAPDGGRWAVAVDSVLADRLDASRTARVALTATPPDGARIGPADLRWTVVNDVVYTHKVFIGTATTGQPELTGLITRRQPVAHLPITAPTAGPVTAGSMLRTGFEHFREGADHLLFLCMVGLAAARRRSRPADTVRRLALLTAMFTVGHSLSLAAAAHAWAAPSPRWVETGIAVTIALAAVHAIRPRLPSRIEPAITLLFGLVHGFGFAGTLREMALGGAGVAVPLLGFNLGLEAAQLLALALIALPLWVVARSVIASAVLAGAAATIAAGWIIERALGVANPLEPVIVPLLGAPERLALLLGVLAVSVLLAGPAASAAEGLPAGGGGARPR